MSGTYPSWLPIWGGQTFEFFRPVFNIADTAISTGVFSIFIFQKWLIQKPEDTTANTATIAVADDSEANPE